ncbi:hypothetical protein K439DRAFT_1629865 [Ramaria rubella]|nr:hypothetical protein K439DRAFT_1641996 [Ramaria rubella]KAF8588403.1 hypothetical protein K439DRAFT_1629865 [Ramaria rubella]
MRMSGYVGAVVCTQGQDSPGWSRSQSMVCRKPITWHCSENLEIHAPGALLALHPEI